METTPLILSHTDNFQFVSESTGYTYDIRVSVPEEEAPAGGYPVYYILDGSSYFQFARDVIRIQSRNAPKTLIDKAIVVGIGHQEADMRTRRFQDFTAYAEEYRKPPRLQSADLGPCGGAEPFLHFIEQELMPYMNTHYQVHESKRCLFGHSLAGYFALWVKFTRPQLFTAYLVCSPSIWWNDHELFAYAERYALDSPSPQTSNMLIAVGALEQFMVDDAKKLVQALKDHQLAVQLYEAPEENHSSVVPTIMSRMFRFGQSCVQLGE